MEHKIINTGDYLLIVDEDVTQAKEGFWIYRDDVKQVYCDKNFWWDFKEPYRKIIAHLPLNNSPILEGIDLLPPLEDQHKDQLLKAVLYSTNRETVVSTLNNMIKMPVGFKCETNIKMGSDMNGRECWDGVEPKTTTNSQGLTQWVGEYIY